MYKTTKELELSLIVKEAMIQQLKFRINKAIEYIKDNKDYYYDRFEYDFMKCLYYHDVEKILDILEGKNNE